MMRFRAIILSLAMVLACAATVSGQAIDGDWTGRLDLGGGRSLKLVLHVKADSSSVKMDSPDQGAYGLGCQTVFMDADSINFRIPGLMMSYEGRMTDGVLRGTFRQGGVTLPLAFEHGTVKVNRPQTPQPPFPYDMEEVLISNEAGGSVLAGTLVLPRPSTSSTPVVVMVSGSGAQDRDETIFEHKPFAVIADHLARHGIASLRYDDRGYGQSTGDRTLATTADYAADAQAVVNWLRSQHRFGKVGILGHSEGGIIACMLAAKDGGPDFVVSVAGPSVPGREILDYQNKSAFMSRGLDEAQAGKMAVEARHRLEADTTMKWMNFFLTYDPGNDLKRLRVPAMIVYGEKDKQVPSSLNFGRAKELAPEADVRSYPGLNHLMQNARTGNVEEYMEIEETFSPQLLDDIVSFLTSRKNDGK